VKDRFLSAYARLTRVGSRTRLARSGRLRSFHLRFRRRVDSGLIGAHGHWFANDETDTLGLAQGVVWDPFEAEIIRRLLRPGDVVLDVGAHIGYFTLLMAREVGRRGCVHAFEPDPGNLGLLERNVRLNGYRNVTIEGAAVSSGPGTVSLYRSLDNRGDNRIVDPGEEARPVVFVPSLSLDDYTAARGIVPDLIKMDIQGAEASALDGMERLIATSPRLVFICEFWPFGLQRAGVDPLGFIARLETLGFEVVHVDAEAERLERPEDGDLARRFPIDAPDRHTNLLCARDPSRLAPLAGYVDDELMVSLRLGPRADDT
jgi:FkbM family methyltransferase